MGGGMGGMGRGGERGGAGLGLGGTSPGTEQSIPVKPLVHVHEYDKFTFGGRGGIGGRELPT